MMKELSMHILDIVQNSIRANATVIEIEIIENTIDDIFSFSVKDNGSGMTKEFINKILDPFTTSRTTRKVGLGLPMLSQTCMQCNGNLTLESTLHVGTNVVATMQYSNIDRPPLGDIINTMHILIIMNEEINIVYKHKYNDKEYTLNSKELRDLLEGVSFKEISVMTWIKESIEEGLTEIRQ